MIAIVVITNIQSVAAIARIQNALRDAQIRIVILATG